MANNLKSSPNKEWDKEFSTDQYITAGLADDIHTFLHEVYAIFEDADEGPRMALFVKEWKASSLGLIYHGRETFRELYEVTEELFDLVKSYAVSGKEAKASQLGLRYAAIYLLYAFYFKQPCRPTVKIRLVLDEFLNIQKMMKNALSDMHYDLMFAWSKLFTDGAFHFTATPIQMGFETAFKMEQREFKEEKSKRKSTDWFASKEFGQLMHGMTKNYANYRKLQEQLIEQKPEANKLFSVDLDLNFPETVKKITANNATAEEEVDDIGDRRRGLKEKFFSTGTVEGHRDRLFAEGRVKAETEAGASTDGVNENEKEWTPYTKKVKKYTRKTGKKGRPKGGGGKKNRRAALVEKNTEEDKDGTGMLENLKIETSKTSSVNNRGSGKGGGRGRGRKKSRVGEKKQDCLVERGIKRDISGETDVLNIDGDAEESKLYINESETPESSVVNTNGKGNGKERGRKRSRVGGRKQVEENTNMEQDPSSSHCFCHTTQWTCDKPICGIEKCKSCSECLGAKCGKPTCDFCSDNPEDGSGRFCKMH